MAFIDGSAVAVVLPRLQIELGTTAAAVQWVVEAYALCLAALLLVGGALGDRFGRRRVFGLGITAFAIASLGCGLAPDAGSLVAARALQGASAALLVPGSLAILNTAYPEEGRGRAIGTWSAVTAIAGAFGPVLGGWLDDVWSWRGVFLINLPLAAIALAIVRARVPESRDDAAPPRIDWGGAVLATLGLGAMTWALIESPARGVAHVAVWGPAVAGIVAIGAFVWFERRHPAPMMPLSVFAHRDFARANLLTFFLYASLAGVGFYLPFALIQVHGFSATAAGAAMLPFIVTIAALSRASGGLVARIGAWPLLTLGPALTSIGDLLLTGHGTTAGPDQYWTTWFPAILLSGTGMGLTVAPLTTTVMAALDVRHSGLASGINNAVSRTGGLIAIAAFGVVIAAVFEPALWTAIERLPLDVASRDALWAKRLDLAAAAPPADLAPALAGEVRRAVAGAFSQGFDAAMTAGAALCALSALIGLSLRRGISRPVGRELGRSPPAAP